MDKESPFAKMLRNRRRPPARTHSASEEKAEPVAEVRNEVRESVSRQSNPIERDIYNFRDDPRWYEVLTLYKWLSANPRNKLYIDGGPGDTRILVVPNRAGRDAKKKDIHRYENFEQFLVQKWIHPTDTVLEIGARCGVVSCAINAMLDPDHKPLHIAIEPDPRVHQILLENKAAFGAGFELFDKAVSITPLTMQAESGRLGNELRSVKDGEAVEVFSVQPDAFRETYADRRFTALVMDCEGCAHSFFPENEWLLETLELIIMERDGQGIQNERGYDTDVGVPGYSDVYAILRNHGFECVDGVTQGNWTDAPLFQQVWVKNPDPALVESNWLYRDRKRNGDPDLTIGEI
jgi:FkbM family methyltransferase